MSLLRNAWSLLLGLVAILLGYVLLAGGRLSWGPLLLVIGYCVALPLFVWRRFRAGVGNDESGVGE